MAWFLPAGEAPARSSRPALIALGLREEGKEKVIDFHLAYSESAVEWDRFLGDLVRRGLLGDTLEMMRLRRFGSLGCAADRLCRGSQ
jgi:hypothetical protein